MGWIASLIAAALIVVAWWTPGTPECAALGWSSVVMWFAALKPDRARLRRMFVAGTATYVGGFYWLYSTMKEFGGFPTPAALAIFALFACGSAVQFVIWGFIWQNLPTWCAKLGLRTAIAWLVANTLWIRIFPWDFGHTQIAFIPFAQIADITGATGITALMMWVVESFVAGRAVFLTAKITSLCTIIASLAYGLWMEHRVPSLYETALKTAIIQGNISLEDKHDVRSFSVNRQRYLELSSEITQPDSLIIWPETTITDWIPSNISDARFAPVLPRPQNGEAFLVGGLTFRSQEQFFNSSILVRPDSSVDTPYNKMILMPFGEYTPFGSVFPWLQEINATAGQFTAGEKPRVLSFNLSSGARIALSPLICYEDIVPELARRATRDGAHLLINQTNDAWFGDTVAPYQHHMIASFRAIENRRFLLRSTNTGLTAVVDPLGQTRAHLQPFTEGILAMEVNLVSSTTWFSVLPVGLLWLLISIGFAATAMVRCLVCRDQSLKRT